MKARHFSESPDTANKAHISRKYESTETSSLGTGWHCSHPRELLDTWRYAHVDLARFPGTYVKVKIVCLLFGFCEKRAPHGPRVTRDGV